MNEKVQGIDIFVDDFNAKDSDAKYSIARLIRILSLEAKRHNFTYHQLNYIFRLVRAKTEIEVPRKSKKLYQLPTHEEVQSFFKSISDPVHRLIFQMLLGLGLREAELCSLQVKHLDLELNQIFIHEGKGKKDRIVIVSEKLKEALKLYLHGRNQKYLFQTTRFDKYSTRRIQQLCAQYRALAQIETPLTPHTFRHLHMTMLANAGVSKERRAMLAGHENEETQTIYSHLGLDGMKPDLLEVFKKLDI